MVHFIKSSRFVAKSLLRVNFGSVRASSTLRTELLTSGPWIYREALSRNITNKLSVTVADHFNANPYKSETGEPVPPGYHLVYFNPETPEHGLDFDGYESHQTPAPLGKFVNRMWLGGSIEFRQNSILKLGDEALCIEKLHDLRHSVRNDNERVIVSLDRRMGAVTDGRMSDAEAATKVSSHWGVREIRSLLYFTADGGKDRESTFDRFLKPPSGAEFRHELTPTQTTLFRFSALTFNSHMIHYDRTYAQKVENLPDIVVHGPLTVVLLLHWMHDYVIPPNRSIKKINYKNLLPLFVDQKLNLCAKRKSDDKFEVWAENHKGSYCVSADLELY